MPLANVSVRRNNVLAGVTWVSLVVGGAGILVLGFGIYCFANPVPREEWVAPESQIAHALVGGFFVTIGFPLWLAGAVMAAVVRWGKAPLERLDRFVIGMHAAAFAAMAVAFAVMQFSR